MAISPAAAAKAVSEGRLFFVVQGGQRCYPSFFLDRAYERRHLSSVVKLLAAVDDVAKWLFFTTPKGSLGAMTPLAALQQRRFASVKRTAEGFAQR
jgi:hypothetical protein